MQFYFSCSFYTTCCFLIFTGLALFFSLFFFCSCFVSAVCAASPPTYLSSSAVDLSPLPIERHSIASQRLCTNFILLSLHCAPTSTVVVPNRSGCARECVSHRRVCLNVAAAYHCSLLPLSQSASSLQPITITELVPLPTSHRYYHSLSFSCSFFPFLSRCRRRLDSVDRETVQLSALSYHHHHYHHHHQQQHHHQLLILRVFSRQCTPLHCAPFASTHLPATVSQVTAPTRCVSM